MGTQEVEPSTQPVNVDSIIKEGKFFAGIGYFSVLCFVPLFLKRDNSFAQFHGRQGLILFILEVAFSMLKPLPVMGNILFIFGWVILGVFSLIGVVKVLMNEYWQMPVIYPIASKVTL